MDTQIINQVLTDFMLQDKIFTSVDVANEVKRCGKWISNTDVAAYLRLTVINLSNQIQIAYKQETISVTTNKGQTTASIYLPVNANVSSYQGTDQSAMTPEEFLKLHPGKSVPGWSPSSSHVAGVVGLPGKPSMPLIVKSSQDPDSEKSVKNLKNRFGFTQREAEVASLMLEGKTIAEISATMGVVPQSVYAYRHEIKKKLDMKNSKASVAFLLEGFLSDDLAVSKNPHAAVNFALP
jgi:DNA-binding CsgD family transcriptional regulator